METEERSPINPEFSSDKTPSRRRCCPRVTIRFIPLLVVTFCFIISSVGNFIVLPQYILARLKREANFSSYNGSELSQCLVNKSDPLYQKEQRIQAVSSSLFGTISLYGGIPNVFTVLLQGVISDRIGRRAIIAVPIVGALISNLGLALIIHYNLSISLYNLFSFLNGVGGQQPAFQTGAFAYVADVTHPEQRSFVFALIEATLLLSNVGTNLAVGYLIKATGYGLPMWVLSAIPAGTLLLLICLPETLKRRQTEEGEGGRCQQIGRTVKMQLQDMRKLLLINRRRSHYLLLLILGYMLYEMITTGAWVISTLYLLNKPFCWNPVQLGYYNAIRTTIWMVGGVVILALFRNKLSDDNMLLLSVTSCVATYVLQGLASEVVSPFCDAVMICAAVVGIMLTVGPVMLRAMCSKMVETTEQGAMFGLMSTGEAFAFAVCGAIFSGIYSASVAFHKGFTLYLCSGLLVLVGCLFTYLRFVLPGVKRAVEAQRRAED